MHGLVSSFFTSATAVTSQLVPLPPLSPHQQSFLLTNVILPNASLIIIFPCSGFSCKKKPQIPNTAFRAMATRSRQPLLIWSPSLSFSYFKHGAWWTLFLKHNMSFLNLEFCSYSLPKMSSPAFFFARKNPIHFSRPRLWVTFSVKLSPGQTKHTLCGPRALCPQL